MYEMLRKYIETLKKDAPEVYRVIAAVLRQDAAPRITIFEGGYETNIEDIETFDRLVAGFISAQPATAMPQNEWAELIRLRAEAEGPDGFATWKDAAIAERLRRKNIEEQTLQEIEPDAYEVRFGYRKEEPHLEWQKVSKSEYEYLSLDPKWEYRKLYTRPQSDKLRKAAEKFFAEYDDEAPDTDSVLSSLENLRAALAGK